MVYPLLDPLILYCLLGAFALLFAFSAIEKFHDKTVFQTQVLNYKLLPEAFVPFLSNVAVLAEISAATLLITQGYLYGAAIGLILLFGYAIGIWINLKRGRTHIDCGCLGSHGEGISYYHVIRNLGLMALLALCLLPVAARTLEWLDYLVLIFFLVGAGLTWVTATMLLSNHMNQRLWWQ